jgi:hypothetical protein
MPGLAQSIAQAAVNDFSAAGITPPSALVRLAAAGKSGREGRHVARDCVRVFEKEMQRYQAVPELFEFQITVLKKPGQPLQGVDQEKHYMLLPHEYLGLLYEHNLAEFQRLFEGTGNALAEFWEHEIMQPWARNNPFLVGHSASTTAIPLGLHGDDAQFVKSGKLLIMSLNGPLCRGSDSRLVLTTVDWARCAPQTLDEVYAVIVWSFEVMGSGRWPSHNHLGQPLTGTRGSRAGKQLIGGRIAVWTETRGDWKWLKESFKFDHYANNRCCHLCGASRVDPNRLYTQTGARAGWQDTRVDHQQYTENFAGELPALARVPGFFLTRVFIDSMHCVCMGVVPYVVGSVIWELQEKLAFQDLTTTWFLSL